MRLCRLETTMRQNPTTVLAITLLGALDGTIVVLSARGYFNEIGSAIAVGLTVIAGAGAWITARQSFHGVRVRNQWRVLAIMALVSSLATAGAAWLGGELGALTLLVLPRVAGLVLLLIALEVGGLSLPRIQRIPLPALLIVAGFAAEGVAQWNLS